MSFLKQKFDLCVFELPEGFHLTEGEAFQKLKSNKFTELSPSHEFGHGWANILNMFSDFGMEDTVASNALVGGYRYDRKKIPSALLNKLFKEKLKEFCKERDIKRANKDDKKIIKQECKDQLLIQTLATPKLASWFIDTENNRVYLSSKIKSVVDSFASLFNQTFEIPLKVKDFNMESEEIRDFLDFLWSNLRDFDPELEEQKDGLWMNQEVTLDYDKNTFKFNGPTIEEYKKDIQSFKKSKKIKSMNVGFKKGNLEYAVTLNNKNMFFAVEILDKIDHESIETAVLDNLDNINQVINQIENLVDTFQDS